MLASACKTVCSKGKLDWLRSSVNFTGINKYTLVICNKWENVACIRIEEGLKNSQ